MNANSSGKYRKHFEDRYLQSREQQLLDLLNQRRAPVPELLMSDITTGEVIMEDVGVSLLHWLKDQRAAPSQIPLALASGIKVVVQIAQIGVWQWDLALRNLMIDPNSGHAPGRVRMIDFGNAVTASCPLQKPLWMLPHPNQHPLLREALQSDWQSFMQRQGLKQPIDLSVPFDLPIGAWQEDWTNQLAVENLKHPWSVLANGVANMLREALNIRSWPGSEGIRSQLSGLTGLFDDVSAQSNVTAVVDLLERSIATHDEDNLTPRPRRFQQKPGTPTNAVACTQLVEMTRNSADPRAEYQRGYHEDPRQADSDAVPEGQPTKLMTTAILLSIGSLSFFGWWTLNQAWEALQTPISNFTLLVLVATCVPTVTTLIRGIPLEGNVPNWYRTFVGHSVAQILIGAELWLRGPSTATLGIIVWTIPSVLGIVAYVCLVRRAPEP
jgi:hypothetical protein